MINNLTFLYQIAFRLIGKTDYVSNEYNLCGSRYTGKTYSISELISSLIAISINNNKKVGIYCFRKLNKEINELVKEVEHALINVGFRHYKDFTLKFPNKPADFRFKGTQSFIRVMGVQQFKW